MVSARFRNWSEFLRIYAAKVGGSLIRYLSQKVVKSSSNLSLFCKKCWTFGIHGEVWRSDFASTAITSDRSVKGCTHSGGGRGVNEDTNFTEFGVKSLGVLNTAAMAVE